MSELSKSCGVCKKTLNEERFSIFENYPSSDICMADKASQICRVNFSNGSQGNYACKPCNTLLTTIYYLEEDVRMKFTTGFTNQISSDLTEIKCSENDFLNDTNKSHDSLAKVMLNELEAGLSKHTSKSADKPNIVKLKYSDLTRKQEKKSRNKEGVKLIKLNIGELNEKWTAKGESKNNSKVKPINIKYVNIIANNSKKELQHNKMIKNELTHFKDNNNDGVFYACETCGRNFTSDRLRKRHVLRRHTIKEIFCDLCEKSFAENWQMKVHISEVHENNTRVNCKECGKSFARQNDLRIHMSSHTGERRYQCKMCDSNFTKQKSLRKHVIENHEPSKNLKCECGKIFPHESLLKSHERYHKKSTCLKCGKIMGEKTFKKHIC